MISGPIWTSILALIMLNERWHVLDMAGAFISLIGVVLIAHPSFLFPKLELEEDSAKVHDEGELMHLFYIGVIIINSISSSFANVLTR